MDPSKKSTPVWTPISADRRSVVVSVCERARFQSDAIEWLQVARDGLSLYFNHCIANIAEANRIFRQHVADGGKISVGHQASPLYALCTLYEVVTPAPDGNLIYFKFLMRDECVDDITIVMVSVHQADLVRKVQR